MSKYNWAIDDIRAITPVRENYVKETLTKTDVVPYVHFYEIGTTIEKYEDDVWVTTTTFLGYEIVLKWEINRSDSHITIGAGGIGWDSVWALEDIEGMEHKLLNQLHVDIIRSYQQNKLYDDFGWYINKDTHTEERKPGKQKEIGE